MNRLRRHCSYQVVLMHRLMISFTTKHQRGGGEGKTDSGSVFKDNFILLWGGKLTHQTFRTENCFSCTFNGHINRDEGFFFFFSFFLVTQPDGTDSWTDWEVTGSTAAFIAHGRKLLLVVVIQNQSCTSFINIFKTLFLFCCIMLLYFLKPLKCVHEDSRFVGFSQRPFEVSIQTDCAQTCYILGCLWTYGGAVRFGETPVSTCGHAHLYCNLNRWVPVGYFFYREKHCRD